MAHRTPWRRIELVHAIGVAERSANRDRHDRDERHSFVRHEREAAVGAGGHDEHPRRHATRGPRPAVRELGLLSRLRRPTYAIKPGATGDISLKGDEQRNDFVAWSHPTLASAYPSPLVVGDQYYTLMDRGFVTSNDPKTGREIYGRQRIAADGGNLFVVSVVLQREDLRGERGRRDVRDAGRSRIQGARKEFAG